MKTTLKRAVAMLLAAVICLSLVACSGSSAWTGKWKISDADLESMKIAEVEASSNDGTRYVTLTADDATLLSEVAADSVRVAAYPIAKSSVEGKTVEELDKESDKLLQETILQDVAVERKDEHTVTLSFQEPEYDYFCLYLYYVHKEAVEDGTFVFGMESVTLDQGDSAEAEITTAVKNGQEDPTLTVKLSNAAYAQELKAEDVTLSGAFEEMTVAAVAVDGDTLTVQTAGEVDTDYSPYGYVQLSAAATDAGAELLAMLEIEHLDAYIDMGSFVLENGLLHFTVGVSGKTLELSDADLAANVTLGDCTVDHATVSEDKTGFTLYIKSSAANLSDALRALNGSVLEIGAEAVGGSGAYTELTATGASLGGVIDSIDKVDGGFKASAELFARSGSLAELSAGDISLTGDFEGAEITSVENTAGGCNIEFTFSAGENDTVFNGYAEIPAGRLHDLWGTASSSNSASLAYAMETGRAYTALQQLFDKIGDISPENFASDVSAVASAFMDSGITKFFSGDILGGLGSLFADVNPSGTEYEIHCMVTDMKLMMQNLDRDIKDLKNSVQAYGDDILAAAQKNTLLALESKWNAFNTNYMERLDRTVTSFDSACRRSLVDFVKSGHGEGLTLYYDKEGKLAVLDKANTFYSVDAKVIDDTKTVTIPLADTSFKACQGVFEKTGFKYTNDFAIALMTDLGNAVKAMNESGNNALAYTDETGEMLFQYLYQQMMFKNLTSDFMDNMRADFVNLCKQITEGQKILDSFDEMMTYKYNFQSEAREDMENIRDSLLVTLFNYGATAAFVENYDSASTNNDMSQAMGKAIGYIKDHNGLYDEPEGYSYCYAVGRPITLRISDLTYYMKINFHSDNALFTDDLREWQYDGYIAHGPYAGYYRAYYEDGTRRNPRNYAFKIAKGYYITDDLNADGRVTMKSNNILSAKDLGLLKARFNALKASGSFPEYNDWTFGEYLTNGKVVKAPSEYMIHLIPDDQFAGYKITPTRIAAAGYKESSFPVDGTRTLICNKDGLKDGLKFTQWFVDNYAPGTSYYEKLKYGGGGYFIPGKAYAIGEGTDEDGDATRPCFREHLECTMPIYDMTTDTMKNDYPVLQIALYGEHHSTWTTDEGAYFRNADYGEKYFIFPIG